MKKITVLLFLAFYSNAFCQGPPPPASEATPENQKLIVELLQVTGYESYFVDYCMRKIEAAGAEKGWSEEKILKYKNNVSFNRFRDSTIFNLFSIYSKEELLQMIALCKKLNESHKTSSDIFFTTGSMQSNLELEIKTYMMDY